MSGSKVVVAAVVVTLAVLGTRHWEAGLRAVDSALGGRPAGPAAGLDIDLRLGFKSRGGWIAEGEDRKVYLLGRIRNHGRERVERLVLEARIQDAGSLGDPVAHELVLGPFEPGERVSYEDLVTYLLPKGQDAQGNELFEFSYELEVLSAE